MKVMQPFESSYNNAKLVNNLTLTDLFYLSGFLLMPLKMLLNQFHGLNGHRA